MDLQRFDRVLLVALTDRSHAHEREVWRSFLTMVLPLLLEIRQEQVMHLLDHALKKSLDELSEEQTPFAYLMQQISTELADFIGAGAELGYAALCEGVSTTTRTHGALRKQVSQEKLLTQWVGQFSTLQQDEEFLNLIQNWKKQFEHCFEALESDPELLPEAS